MLIRQWYVVQTKSRKEAVAVENLQRQGYDAYCPQIVRARHLRKRWQQIAEPLFPRYLFVQLSIGIDNFLPIRSTKGVAGLVSFGNFPAIMPSHVIAAIREQELYISANAKDHPDWKKGDRVYVIDGPFAGMNGIFEEDNDEHRVCILLDMLGRNNSICISADSIVPAQQA